jgi:hypothetical protein
MLDSRNPIKTFAQKFFVVLGTCYGNLDQIVVVTGDEMGLNDFR